MDAPAWTVIGVGAGLVGAVGASLRRGHGEPRAQGRWIEARGEDLRERMTHLKGLRDEVAGAGVV